MGYVIGIVAGSVLAVAIIAGVIYWRFVRSTW
jgi:hypothetical protein